MDASVFKNILNLLPEMVFVLNDKRTTVIFNKPVKELTGYEEGKLLSTPFEQFLPESFRDDFLKRILTPENSSAFEMQMTCSNSSILDVSAFMKRMVLNGNNYDVLIANDITERKQIELELLRFSNVIHHTTNPIQITDAQGTMIYVNPAFERISGYSQNDLVGNNPRMLNSGTHSKAFWKEMWETITSGEVWTGEVENKRRDGTRFQVELLISPILDDAGSIIGYLGSHRDITEQKKLERQLVRSQKMESIGTLAAGIAHEVGYPLTSISSLVQIIQRTSKDGFAQEKLELIKNQINRISQILRALVDFSRPSPYVIKPTNVNHIILEALNIVRYGKRVKQVEFVTELAEVLHTLELVPDQVLQVFINILINAVDALEDQKGIIKVFSRVNHLKLDILISDNGRGIPQEDLDKVFEPFFTTKEIGKGTGLGLWVSYGIMKNFGGDITVESELGKGSTFIVSFPLRGRINA